MCFLFVSAGAGRELYTAGAVLAALMVAIVPFAGLGKANTLAAVQTRAL